MPNGVEAANTPSQDEGSHVLLGLLIVLAKHKMLVLGLPLAAGIVALIVALLLPNIYTATARILPPQQRESSAAAMVGLLTGAAGGAAANVGQAFGIRNPNDLYVGILKGHTIADRLIERFGLRELYNAKTLMRARKVLDDVSRISTGRDGLITIEIDDRDPNRAAELANGYVAELDRLMQGLAVTEAAQRRLFFEKQLASAQEQLIVSETDLRRAIEAKGIAGVDAQSRAVVSTTEQLRAQIAVKEIQLDAMRTFATERNPEAVRLRQEVASMRGELARLETGRPGSNAVQSPAGLESIRKLRQVKFLEFTVELLTKQYEVAKIDEAKDAVLIQVVDKAVPPDYKSRPRRALLVIATVLAIGILAVLWAFIREAIERTRGNPEGAKRLAALHRHLRWR